MMRDFHDELVDLIRTDAGLASWAEANFGPGKRITLVPGGRQAGQFKDAELPGALVYAEAAELEPVAGGGTQVDVTTGLWSLIAWRNEKQAPDGTLDVAAGLAAFLDLVDEMTKAIIRRRTMNGRVARAWLSSWVRDDSKEPVVIGRFYVSAVYRVTG